MIKNLYSILSLVQRKTKIFAKAHVKKVILHFPLFILFIYGYLFEVNGI